MKTTFFISILTTLLMLISSAFAATETKNISGFVTLEGSGYIFIDSTTQKRFELKPSNTTVSGDLKKLSNFDSITGKATLMGKGKDYPVLLLDSIDFVGLRKLLGLWKSDATIMNFIDYNEVSFYFTDALFNTTGKKTMYRYSVSPKSGTSWRVFFSDDDSVVLGSLSVDGRNAFIQLFDAETGETTKTYSLEKVN